MPPALTPFHELFEFRGSVPHRAQNGSNFSNVMLRMISPMLPQLFSMSLMRPLPILACSLIACQRLSSSRVALRRLAVTVETLHAEALEQGLRRRLAAARVAGRPEVCDRRPHFPQFVQIAGGVALPGQLPQGFQLLAHPALRLERRLLQQFMREGAAVALNVGHAFRRAFDDAHGLAGAQPGALQLVRQHANVADRLARFDCTVD